MMLIEVERDLQRRYPGYQWQFVTIVNRDAVQLYITHPGRDDNYSAIIAHMELATRSRRGQLRFIAGVGRKLIKLMSETPPLILGEVAK